MGQQDLSIIIPAYNEEDSIEQTLEEVGTLAVDHGYRVIVVNDGSSDRTGEVLANLALRMPQLSVITHEYNMGYGAALKSGLRAAESEYIAITDADGTYPNDRIPELARRCLGRDMVVGARIGQDVQYSKLRALPKVFLRAWISWLAGRKVPDINSGLRVFRRDVAEKFMGIYPNGFSFTITITLSMITTQHFVEYVPISYRARIGTSKIRPIRDTSRFIKIILRTGVYFAPIRAFFPFITIVGLMALASLTMDVYNADLTEKTLLLFLFTMNTGMFILLADMIDKRSKQ